MGNVSEVITVAASYRQSEQLPAVEAQPQSTGFSFRSIDHDGMASSPTHCCFRTCDIAQFNSRLNHAFTPSV
jgi:hypothetical protein